MTDTTTNIRKVVFAKPANWKTWLSFVQIKAINSGIWDLINPNIPTKPIGISQPVRPIMEIAADATIVNRDAFTYSAKSKLSKNDLSRME
jgi:hypothetical protein